MKENGFTLVEVVISIAILLILFTIGITSVKMFNTIENSINENSFLYEMTEILSYGKLYCKKNNTSGVIYIDNDKDEVRFVVASKEIKKITINDDMEFYSKPDDNKINLTSKGYINTATTLGLKGSSNNKYKITISVGNDIVNVYKEEK